MTDKFIANVDYIYAKEEDYVANPKEQFKVILEWIKDNIESEGQRVYDLIDLGCARGELLYFLKNNLSDTKFNFVGVDCSKKITDLARQNNEDGVLFFEADVEDWDDLIEKSPASLEKRYDFITILGVIEYFDFPDRVIKNIHSMLKDGGKAMIINILNEYDIDVRVRYRNNKYFNDFRKGWSLHSLETFKDILEKNNFKICQIRKFFPSVPTEQKKDPARSWMVKMPTGEFKYKNGLSQLYDAYILEVEKCA